MEFRYSMHVDLIYHVLAYMKVDNASNCYSQQYIDRMSIEKGSFEYNIEAAMKDLQGYYNKNFSRLMMINFLPFNCTNYDEMKHLFLNYHTFTDEDKQFFLLPLIEAFDKEIVFYFPYWKAIHNSYQKERFEIEHWMENEFIKYKSIFDYFNKPIVLYLSLSITKNGRGYGRNDCFLALSPFADSIVSYGNIFFQALHEYTHQFTDILVSNISMNDNTHNISELVVIIADYYIIKSFDPISIVCYFDWINKIYSNTLKITNDEEFFDIFKLDNHLFLELKKILNGISSSITV